MIKSSKLLLPLLFLFLNAAIAQNVQKIETKEGSHYITTRINYPITGTYLYSGDLEPIVQLNADGTGVFQLQDLSKTNIEWGIECLENGTPKYQKGFNYAVYSLWYKNNSELDAEWTYAHYSIHFQKKKMFISGERSKSYTMETEELVN